ncbi:hypothetical protein [Serinibacter salmoneus]|uniref:Type III secretion system (T3SS) SseB-like protein n=1 Tax=Serinibacter salmoneus TaxID=556530 RepID=A0A2A9CZC5_9MICO|nr:hypothetical protein [Serinibacter salmoneus]PFG19476.1 hypothetical protein ATL40_1040 [Serinibacter salmoneus]
MSEPSGNAESVAQLAAWQDAFGLEKWFFIARGSDEEPTPFAMQIEERGVVATFTSPERAVAFAAASGLPEEEGRRLLAVPVDRVTDLLMGYMESGVDTLVLDPGTQDAALLLAALPHVKKLAAIREVITPE